MGAISPKNKEFYPQDTLKTLFLYNYPYDCKSDWVFRGCLKSFLTNAYAWFATLAVLGAGKRWLDKETGFTRYMASRSFGFYVLHYPLLALGAFAMDRLLHLPVWSMYLLLPILMVLILPPLVALIKQIPVLKTLILGK